MAIPRGHLCEQVVSLKRRAESHFWWLRGSFRWLRDGFKWVKWLSVSASDALFSGRCIDLWLEKKYLRENPGSGKVPPRSGFWSEKCHASLSRARVVVHFAGRV
jgi:hypothetical protein